MTLPSMLSLKDIRTDKSADDIPHLIIIIEPNLDFANFGKEFKRLIFPMQN